MSLNRKLDAVRYLTKLTTVFFILAHALLCSAALADLSEHTESTAVYERDGQRIAFEFQCDGGCTTGLFANDWDIWVAPQKEGGTVILTAMEPRAEGNGKGFVNGAMADVLSMSPTQGWHGWSDYDSRLTINPPHAIHTSQEQRPVVILRSVSAKGAEKKCTKE